MRNEEGVFNNMDSSIDHRFACNICLDQVSEPVVTRCGHLYCWPCLYQWLEPGMTHEECESIFNTYISRRMRHSVDRSRRMCPVCKSDCSVLTVIPIYVREATEREGTNDANKTVIFKDGKKHGDKENERDCENFDDNFDDIEDIDDVDDVDDIHGPAHEEHNGAGEEETQQQNVGLGLRRRRTHISSDGAGNTSHTGSSSNGHFVTDDDIVPNRPQPPPPPSSLPPETANNAYGREGRQTFQADAILDILTGLRHTRAAPIPSIHNPGSARDEVEGEQILDNNTSLIGNLLLVFGSIVLLILLLF